jgi:hypothetical protein
MTSRVVTAPLCLSIPVPGWTIRCLLDSAADAPGPRRADCVFLRREPLRRFHRARGSACLPSVAAVRRDRRWWRARVPRGPAAHRSRGSGVGEDAGHDTGHARAFGTDVLDGFARASCGGSLRGRDDLPRCARCEERLPVDVLGVLHSPRPRAPMGPTDEAGARVDLVAATRPHPAELRTRRTCSGGADHCADPPNRHRGPAWTC